MIDYQYLCRRELKVLRYRLTRPDEVDDLLESATGCVLGSRASRSYLDIIVAMVPLRLEFDSAVELKQVISLARLRGIPIHRDMEMAAVLATICALAVAVLAFTICSGL